jgi:hypothetical protein
MGSWIQYHADLRIDAARVARALELMNELHSHAMRALHAKGGVDKYGDPCYALVDNREQPFETLVEALDHWRFVGPCAATLEDGSVSLEGVYDYKLGQQDVLLRQLAPVLDDTTIRVVGEDEDVMWRWVVADGVLRTEHAHITWVAAGAEPPIA